MDDIESAVRTTGRKVARHKQEMDDHLTAVLAALRAGKRPTDVAAWSPLSATYLRKVARKAGIPAAVRQKTG